MASRAASSPDAVLAHKERASMIDFVIGGGAGNAAAQREGRSQSGPLMGLLRHARGHRGGNEKRVEVLRDLDPFRAPQVVTASVLSVPLTRCSRRSETRVGFLRAAGRNCRIGKVCRAVSGVPRIFCG